MVSEAISSCSNEFSFLFTLLQKGDKLKLSEVQRPNKVGRTNDPNYCLFYRMVHHPTNKCFILKNKIQGLIDAGVLILKLEQKKSLRIW